MAFEVLKSRLRQGIKHHVYLPLDISCNKLHTHVSIRSLHEKLVPEYLPSLIRSVQSYLRSHICTCITDKYNIYYPNLAFITATARIYSLKSCIFGRCFHKSEGCLLNIEVSCVLNTRFLLDNAH